MVCCMRNEHVRCHPHSSMSLSEVVEVRGQVHGRSSSKVILEDSLSLGVLGNGLMES